MIDLHCHSTASDGLRSPGAVVAHAAQVGLATLALTDHDTLDGLPAAFDAGARVGVRIIGGCEFSVAAPWGEMHLLGYFLTPGAPPVEAFLTAARAMRSDRARAMVSALHRSGVAISFDDVLAHADRAALGRPHVARALLQLGHVTSIQAAFDRYLGRGKPGYVEKVLPPFAEVAALVHAEGGVVSAAHLKSEGTRARLEALKEAGLDAVEVRHPSHDGERVAILTEAAIQLDLARTGGSDWHGEDAASGGHADLGSQQVPDDWLVVLDARRPPRPL